LDFEGKSGESFVESKNNLQAYIDKSI